MKKNEIVAIIDSSFSMSTILNESIDGFNYFVDQQRQDNEDDTLSLVFFDSSVKEAYENKRLGDVEKLTPTTYVLGGMTALYDAVGSTIDKVGQRLANTPEHDRPEKVVVAILTDGEENSSMEYTSERVKEMINHQRDVYSWEFIFLAASEGGLKDGAKIGITGDKAIAFAATSAGTQEAYVAMAATTRSSKSM